MRTDTAGNVDGPASGSVSLKTDFFIPADRIVPLGFAGGVSEVGSAIGDVGGFDPLGNLTPVNVHPSFFWWHA